MSIISKLSNTTNSTYFSDPKYVQNILSSNPDLKFDITYTTLFDVHYHKNVTQDQKHIESMLNPFFNSPCELFNGKDRINVENGYINHKITINTMRMQTHPCGEEVKGYPQKIYQKMILEFKLKLD